MLDIAKFRAEVPWAEGLSDLQIMRHDAGLTYAERNSVGPAAHDAWRATLAMFDFDDPTFFTGFDSDEFRWPWG